MRDKSNDPTWADAAADALDRIAATDGTAAANRALARTRLNLQRLRPAELAALFDLLVKVGRAPAWAARALRRAVDEGDTR